MNTCFEFKLFIVDNVNNYWTMPKLYAEEHVMQQLFVLSSKEDLG
jgi:hypothetical protein